MRRATPRSTRTDTPCPTRRASDLAEELGQSGSAARPARGEAERLIAAINNPRQAREKDLAGLADLEARLTTAEEAPEEEPDTSIREQFAQAARDARQAEMDARLALRTSEERARALHGRADGLLRAARQEREARAKARERHERLVREGKIGRAHVRTPVTNAHIVCRLLLEKQTRKHSRRENRSSTLDNQYHIHT